MALQPPLSPEDKTIILEQINEMINSIKSMEANTDILKEMVKTLESKLANLQISN